MLELYKNIKALRQQLNMTQAELAERTGYTDRSSIAKIEKGEVDLPQSKIALFAKALDTTSRELMGNSGIENADSIEDSEGYYLNPETAQLAQELFENKDLRMLFDASRDSKPEDLQMAADLLQRLKRTNPSG